MAEDTDKKAPAEAEDIKKTTEKKSDDSKKAKTTGKVKNKIILDPEIEEEPGAPVTYDRNVNEALTALQRTHRAQVMRRIEPKLKRAKELAQSRLANDAKLKVRAQKAARNIIRDRLAGRQGVSYADMDTATKIRLDKQLESKVGAIKRLAQRLFPKVRQAEQKRHHDFTHKDMTDHKAKTMAESVLLESLKTGEYAEHLAAEMDKHHGQTYEHPRWGKIPANTRNISRGSGHGLASGQGNRESGHFIKRDHYHKVPEAKLKAAEDHVIRSKPKMTVKGANGDHKTAYDHGKHMVVDHGNGYFSVHSKSKYTKVNEAFDKTDGAANADGTSRYKKEVIVGKDGKRRVVTRAVKIKSIEERVDEGLQKKADSSGFDRKTIDEVYARGIAEYNPDVTPTLTKEQYAFGRVNKFLADQSIDEDLTARFRRNIKRG